jgi:serine/threonine-protein kinase
VKVLDFGLAKAMDAVGSAQSAADRELVSQSPTITNPALTQSGMILGTAAYMSPEQASGRPVDKRADIWSFGIVFFEMLSGQRLFGGQTIGHTLADVLRTPIDAGKLPKETPRVVRTVVARCLDRDVKTRLRDIGEARVTIGKYRADPANGEAPHGTRPARQWVAWAAAGVLAVFVIAGWLRPRPESSSPAADLVLTIAPVAGRLARVGDIHATPEISPDGSAVMFYGDGAHLRRLNQLARIRAHRPLHKSRILVPRLAVVRVYRRDQLEEDARA